MEGHEVVEISDEQVVGVSDDDDVIFVTDEELNQVPQDVNITEIPDDILRRILLEVVKEYGDVAFNRLSLTCRKFRDVVSNESFRNEAHFSWLDTAHHVLANSIQLQTRSTTSASARTHQRQDRK
ncbi:unnamed protein product [Leuciscus chuanchicus]